MQTITIAPPKRSWFSLLSWAVVLAVLVVSWQGAEMAPLTLIKDGGNIATFAADFFPPDFSQWQDYLTEIYRHAANRRLGHRAGGGSLHPLWPDERRKPGAVVGLPARSPPDGRLPRH